MIRSLFVSAFFFFGPMLLMFLLRNLGVLFRLWMAERRRRAAQPDIIDIRPRLHARPSLAFVLIAVVAGSLSAYWAWRYTQRPGVQVEQQYVPAHLDAQGRLVPGHLAPAPVSPPGGSNPAPSND